ncbi:MAG: ABC transporter permease [Myxococcaceae bacterium]|nr:ABC transporter permease [Myxococcaceae bacterium]
MSATSLTERLEERAGPLVLKEVRQGLRAKVFGISFGLLLLACLVVALVAAADGSSSYNDHLGRQYLAVFLAGLSLVSFFVIPYTAYRSMAREREDETWVLLVLTGLSSRSIVRGKVASALSQALLYGSACAPFVLFSYFLNGVDLLTVVAALVLAATWCVFLVSVAVAMACEASERLMRAGVHLLVVFGSLGATAMGVGFGVVLAEEGSRAVQKDVFWVVVAGVVLAGLTGALAVAEGAASTLALATSRRGYGARLVVAGQVVLGFLITVAAAVVVGDRREVPAAGSIVSALLLFVYGFFAASQPDGASKAQRTGRWLSTPGGSRGFAVMVLLTGLSLAGYLALAVLPLGLGSTMGERATRLLIAAPCYALLYVAIGTWLGRVTPLARLGEPRASRIAILGSTFLGVVAPVVTSLLFSRREDGVLINALNPIVGMANLDRNRGNESPALGLLVVATVVATAMAWVALKSRDGEQVRG